MNPLDFELEIQPGADGAYPVALLSAPAGTAQGVLRLPFDTLEQHLRDIQIAQLRSGNLRRTILTPDQQKVQSFGAALFDALFAGEIRERYDASRAQAWSEDRGLRIRLRILPPELAVLPWEYLFDRRRRDYLCLSIHTPVVRHIAVDDTPAPLAATPPLRVLAVISSPKDQPRLDLARERRRLEGALSGLTDSGLVELRWLEQPSSDLLQRTLRDGPWHIFHFVGHGGFDRPSQEGFLAFVDGGGMAEPVYATGLARLLGDHRTLRLAVLNACEGARASDRDDFSSSANILVLRGVPAVLAMRDEISDEAAAMFAGEFYRALADGLPVDVAVVEARKVLSRGLPSSFEWGVPVLLMGTPDGMLFDLRKTPPPVGEVRLPEAARPVAARGSYDSAAVRPWWSPMTTLSPVTVILMVSIVLLLAVWRGIGALGGATPTPSATTAVPTSVTATVASPEPPTRPAPTQAAPTVAPVATTGFPETPTLPLDEAIVTRFPAPGQAAEGIAWDGTSLWVADNSRWIFQLDPAGRLLNTYPAPEVTPQGVAWDGDAWWLYTTARFEVYRFRFEDGRPAVLSSFVAPVKVTGGNLSHDLAWDGEALWYANEFTAYRLDSAGEVIATIPQTEQIAGIDWDGERLLLAFNDLEAGARVDVCSSSGERLETRSLPVYSVTALAWGGPYLWVLGRDSLAGELTLYKLDWQRLAR